MRALRSAGLSVDAQCVAETPGAMLAIEERGLSVPEDIAVVGYNNTDQAALVRPALTTVAAPSYELVAAAMTMTMLLDLIAGRKVKKRRVTLPTRLIVRRSCGCDPQTSQVSKTCEVWDREEGGPS